MVGPFKRGDDLHYHLSDGAASANSTLRSWRAVAYLSVAVIAHDGVSPYEFLFYRVVDTFLGVGIGSLVGSFHTHGKKRNDVLFVAELDDELRSAHRQISEI